MIVATYRPGHPTLSLHASARLESAQNKFSFAEKILCGVRKSSDQHVLELVNKSFIYDRTLLKRFKYLTV